MKSMFCHFLRSCSSFFAQDSISSSNLVNDRHSSVINIMMYPRVLSGHTLHLNMQRYLWNLIMFLYNTQICICWDQSPEWSTYLQPEWSGQGVKYGWHLGPWCQLARHHIFEQQWKPVCLLKESYSPVGLICHIHLVWCVVSPHSSMDGNLSVKRFWWVLGYNQISKLFWTLLDTYPFIDLNNMDQAWVLCDIQCAHITL